MDLYFAGTEQKMWRTRLDELGVEHVSLSWIGMRRRGQRQLNTPLAELYPPGQKIYLDSGAYTLNKDDAETIDEQEARDLAVSYYEYFAANRDRIEFASEFDALVLTQWGIRAIREDQGLLRDEKLMPVWHSEWGLHELRRLAEEYPRVGVLQDDTTSSDLTQHLRRVSHQTKLHGVAMTKMESMRAIPWTSVGSTSWLSPTQFGDTFVWTGRELKRYPKRMKDIARKRHRTWLVKQGFDIEKIEADDNAELLRLSVWSWQNYATSLNKGRAVTTPAKPSVPEPFPGARDAIRDAVGQILGIDGESPVTTEASTHTDPDSGVVEVSWPDNYAARHHRVHEARGKAAQYECETCDQPAQEWAQLHETDGTAPADYVPLCARCHRTYDEAGNRTLDWEQAAEIKRRFDAKEPRQAIADEFGVSLSTVKKIGAGKTWDRGALVTVKANLANGQNAEIPAKPVAIDPPEVRNEELALPAGKKLLPVLGFSYAEQTDADGSKHRVPIIETPSSGLLRCDSCYMADKCPAMTPGSDCAYEIPVKIRTAGQLAALHDSLIEMQTQRVLLMRMIEQTEGGYVDANLSNEIDRLNKMIKTKNDAGKDGISINIANVTSSGQPGMISRVFGKSVSDKMGSLPQGEIDSAEYVDADLVDEEQ